MFQVSPNSTDYTVYSKNILSSTIVFNIDNHGRLEKLTFAITGTFDIF